MSRNILYLLVGALAVAVLFLGYQYYQESQTEGLEIEINGSGLSIEAD
ncbi:hypothetical protein [Alkalilacustris brevis]|nr:hypothetical protein [Alkalilacustris brevis]